LLVVDGTGQARLDALVTFRTQTAGQAAFASDLARASSKPSCTSAKPVTRCPAAMCGIFWRSSIAWSVFQRHVVDRFAMLVSSGREIFAPNEAVDGNRRLLARLDGFHHRGRTGDRIAAGEDVGSSVCNVTPSTFMVPQSLRVQAHSSVRQAQSLSWPMAGTTASTSIENSDPGIGSGRRRPPASGSPRLHA
jgi:hypothetical protein